MVSELRFTLKVIDFAGRDLIYAIWDEDNWRVVGSYADKRDALEVWKEMNLNAI